MLGADIMSTRDINVALLATIPESEQKQILDYLLKNFCQDNMLEPKSQNEIYSELAESRASYEHGNYRDFDAFIDELGIEYGI
jgi:hypothetical protein